jgi:hypothetical protein
MMHTFVIVISNELLAIFFISDEMVQFILQSSDGSTAMATMYGK